jgi:hypothetical protein
MNKDSVRNDDRDVMTTTDVNEIKTKVFSGLGPVPLSRHQAVGRILNNRKSPSRLLNQIDNMIGRQRFMLLFTGLTRSNKLIQRTSQFSMLSLPIAARLLRSSRVAKVGRLILVAIVSSIR